MKVACVFPISDYNNKYQVNKVINECVKNATKTLEVYNIIEKDYKVELAREVLRESFIQSALVVPNRISIDTLKEAAEIEQDRETIMSAMKSKGKPSFWKRLSPFGRIKD